MSNQNAVIFVRNIPTDVHEAFQAKCYLRGVGRSQAICEMLRLWTDGQLQTETRKQPVDKKPLMIANVDPELKEAFAVKCQENDTNMSQVILSLMKWWASDEV